MGCLRPGSCDHRVHGSLLDRIRDRGGDRGSGAQVWLDLHATRGPEDTVWRRMIGRVFPAVLSCGCLALAGLTLIVAAGGGLYWLVPSVLAALIFGLINVWVLLVEILR
jgi:hypothetical protein